MIAAEQRLGNNILMNYKSTLCLFRRAGAKEGQINDAVPRPNRTAIQPSHQLPETQGLLLV